MRWDYEVLESLGATAGSLLWRARRVADQTSVLLKMPSDHASSAHLLRFRSEYALLSSVDVAGIPRPVAYHSEPLRPLVVLEDAAGTSLATLSRAGALGWQDAVRLAIELARILDRLHALGVIHGDMRPSNVLADVARGRVAVVDLMHASTLGYGEILSPRGDVLERDWAYVAPEQTGLLKRTVDRRADLYSLGVLLYRLVTGALPYEAHDALEWAHCHVARQAIPPRELARDLPPAIETILLKLLAKEPDDRYQTARGLIRDLEQCQRGSALAFTPALHDRSDQLCISDRLYARDEERGALLALLEQITESRAPGLALLTGAAGVGKSSVVAQLRASVQHGPACFVAGRVERDARQVPYAALADAAGQRLRRALAGSDQELAAVRARLEQALEGQGAVLGGLIPFLSRILGEHEAPPVLPPHEASARFMRLLVRFLQALPEPHHPLVLFIDDLQWVDAGTLEVLEQLLVDPDTRDLLLITAYRDDEVRPDHAAHGAITRLSARGAPLRLHLDPLAESDIRQLLADTLGEAPGDTRTLAALLLQKTRGNPLFVRRFLQGLSRDGSLRFDSEETRWRWDLARIRAAEVSDDVANLLAQQLVRFGPATRGVLAWASCLGQRFALAELAALSEQSAAQVREALSPALEDGMILLSTPSAYDEDEGPSYRWLHDRLQQAAYVLVPAAERAARHLAVARRLWQGKSAEQLGPALFDVVSQLGRGRSCMTDRDERERAAELHLKAARCSASTGAQGSALHFLATGQALLADDAWETCRDLAFALAFETARGHWLTGALEMAGALLAQLAPRAASPLELADVHNLQLQVHLALGDVASAVRVEREALTALGVAPPEVPSWDDAARERERVTRLLSRHPLERVAEQADIADARLAAALRIRHPSYFVDSKLYAWRVARMVAIRLEHGNADEAPLWYATYGFVLTAYFDAHAEAAGFVRAAHEVLAQRRVAEHRAAICFLSSAVLSWTSPFEEALSHSRRGFREGVEHGDATSAAYCANLTLTLALQRGEPLAQLDAEAARYLAFDQRTRQLDPSDVVTMLRRFMAALQGHTRGLDSLDGDGFEEQRFEASLASGRMSSLVCWYWIYRARSAFLAGHRERALSACARAEPLLYGTAGLPPLRDFCLYDALARLDAAANADVVSKAEHLAVVAKHQRRLGEWGRSNPAAFRHVVSLIAAEVARVGDRPDDAVKHYDESLRAAHEAGFVHEEALAHELAAAFYARRGQDDAAELHLEAAQRAYRRWGAEGKVRQIAARQRSPAPRVETRSVAQPVREPLEAAALLKAAQAISSEIVLERLLDRLMRVVLESAGAERGCLLLVEGSGFAGGARAEVREGELRVHIELEQHTAHELPWSLLHYVQRTHERAVVGEDLDAGPFAADPYLASVRPRSALCLPILRQGTIMAVLYLENGLLSHAFSSERLPALELLASQIAISLDNARLYERLEKEKTKLEVSLHEVTRLKQVEEQFRQVQKMDAIGQLAGGVAHDFNNLLGVILGYGQMLTRKLPAESREHADVEQILRAAERGAGLTRQLLAFGRRQVLEPRIVEVGTLLRDAEPMLRRLIGEDLELVVRTVSEPAYVRADPGQLQQVMLNLTVNARDAMPDGGTLTLSAARTTQASEFVAGRRVAHPGDYILFTVTDTGTGIDALTQQRMFEPFFTTKPIGQGTGLGLATVYGIIKQSNGHIWVESELGRGTTFFVYLPAAEVAHEAPVSAVTEARAEGSETVLLVEDQDSLRIALRRGLEDLGYRVLEAESAEDALAIARDEAFDVVATDVVMPRVSGVELVERLRAGRPSLPAIYMSGYTYDVIQRRGLAQHDALLIEKPFSAHDLGCKIRAALRVR